MRGGIQLAAIAAVLLVLTACGATEDTAADGAAPRSSTTPDSSGTSDSPKSQGDAEGEPLNLAAAAWPVDLAAAKAFYEEMPDKFKTWPAMHPRYAGSSTGVTYGSATSGANAWSMEADKTVPDAHAALAMMFGMAMSCDKATYQGTAAPDRRGLMPGFGSGKDADPWWFTCQVNGSEGSPHYRAFAIGWTSGNLGWLVVTPDEDTSRELLDIMVARTK